MALDVYFVSDIRAALVAGAVLSIETATANGRANDDHLAGILTMAKHQALTFSIPWAFVVNDARASLGSGYAGLLDVTH